MDLLRIIAAILLPPLGVFLQVGFGGHFWLNILLTLLGYIPGNGSPERSGVLGSGCFRAVNHDKNKRRIYDRGGF